jgi:hypothetical protein
MGPDNALPAGDAGGQQSLLQMLALAALGIGGGGMGSPGPGSSGMVAGQSPGMSGVLGM